MTQFRFAASKMEDLGVYLKEAERIVNALSDEELAAMEIDLVRRIQEAVAVCDSDIRVS